MGSKYLGEHSGGYVQQKCLAFGAILGDFHREEMARVVIVQGGFPDLRAGLQTVLMCSSCDLGHPG